MKYLDKFAVLFVCCLMTACGGGGGNSGGSNTNTGVDVYGRGVKGPLAGAIVRLYNVDLSQADLKGTLLDEGSTGSDAAITGLSIQPGLSGLLLMEFVADADTTDTGTGMAPVIDRLTTVVDVQRIYNGDAIYATPLTSMAVSLAQANADKGAPYAGNSDGPITTGEFTAALAVAQNQVKSTLGFGLDSNVDIFSVPPILTADTTTAEQQARVVQYRQAIEAIAALADQVASESSASDTAQEIFDGLTEDLKDGVIDGLNDTTPVTTLAALDTPIGTTLGSLDPETLVIPNTSTPITDIEQTLEDELATTGEVVDTTPLAEIEVNPAPPVLVAESVDTYAIGGTLAGLTGSVVLQNNAGDDLTLSANGAFSFATPIADGNAYNVTVVTQPAGQTCSASINSGTVSGANVTDVAVSCTTQTYTVGGSVSGLSGSVVLQNNGGDDLTVNGDGEFTFNTSMTYGNTYNVSVLTQPPGQTCSASTNSGTVGSANVSNVAVTCSTNAYTIGGSVSGLTGSVVLQNNSGDDLTVNGDGDFTFNTAIADGSSFSVTVLSQPVGQTCLASGNTGSVSGANVITVAVTCATYHSIGGTLSGLPYLKTVTLLLNGGNNLILNNDGSFQFATPIADGGSYAVTVSYASAGLDCTATNNTGTVNGDFVRDVVVTCTTQTHTVGGSVTGLSGSLVLQNNGGDDLTLNAGDNSFTFNTAITYGRPYSVSVLTQPAGQTCVVTNGVGSIDITDVTNVTVSCTTNSYTVGGAVSGLSGTVVLQNNGGDDLTINADRQYVFDTPIIHGGSYSVSVLTQPSGQTCVASNNTGTVNGAKVTNVAITCTDHSYTIGGNVSGLSGSVVLQNNGGDDLTLNGDGDFTFNTAIINGASYNVTVLTQPAGQTCTASSNTGSISAANVINVVVTCSTNSYTIGGTVSGLSGSVVLQNNGGDDLTINADMTFTFNTSIADGGSYNVSVFSQPAGQLCTASSNSGVVSGANVSTVSVSCVSAYSIGGTVSGLSGSVVLQNNGGDDLTVNADGAFSFNTPVADTGNYSVAVSTQPANLTCFVGSPSGQVSGADITNIFVFCSSPELDADVISDTVTLDWMDVGASSYNLYYSSASDCDIANYASCANGTLLTNVTPPLSVTDLAVEQNWWFQLESVVTGANGVAQVGVRTSQVSPQGTLSGIQNLDHGFLNAITHDSSGRTYLGGDFAAMANVSGRGVVASAARADGTATGHARAYPVIGGGNVHAAASDGNGGYYIGGNFTEVDGQPHSGLAHVLPSGELDPYWTPQADNTVYSIAVAGSTVYVGGDFLNIDGLSHAHLAAIDTDGNLQSWDPGLDGGVRAMQLSGTTLYIGGGFGSVGGNARGKLAAIDTTTGNLTNWTPATVNDGEVRGLVVYNGSVYFGGTFTQVDGATHKYLAAVDSNGALTTWDPAPDQKVYSLAISGSTIYAGGYFSAIGGGAHYYLAAIDATNGTVQNWPTGYSLSVTGSVRSLAVHGSTVYVGGDLSGFNGTEQKFAAAYGTDGSFYNWDVAVDDHVYALAADDDTVFVGGTFNLQGGVARSNLAALEADDSLDLNWAPAADDVVEALAVSGSTLYLGGQFTSIDDGSGAQTRNRLAAIGTTDGALDANWAPLANGAVHTLAVDGSGTVYAGGAFTNIDDGTSYPRSYLAAIDSSGYVVSGWVADADDEVFGLSVSGSTVYVGGNFYTINGTTRKYLAAMGTDGNLDPWSPSATAYFYSGMQAVSDVLVSGSTVYIAGAFAAINDGSGNGNVSIGALAAIGTDGLLTSWEPAPYGEVYSIALSGSTLYAAGQFSSIGVTPRNYAAGINTGDGTATSLDPDLDFISYAVDAHNGKVYFGGEFTTQGGMPSPLLTILPE